MTTTGGERSPSGLNVVQLGSGEPLLMIMGVSGTHMSWGSSLLTSLARDFTCITYDHRGIGQSVPVDGPFTVQDLAADAVAVLDELGVDTAHVLGVSMGGMVAQELALTHPDRVRSVVLGCTSGGRSPEPLLGGAQYERLGRARASGDHEQAMRIAFELNVSGDYAADPEHFAEFRRITMAVPAPPVTIAYQVFAVNQHDTRSRLPGLVPPCLIVHGDEDQVIPLEEAHLLADLIPDAKIRILPGVGHGFWWERTEFTASLLREHAALSLEGKTNV